jgi:hypothetical protein
MIPSKVEQVPSALDRRRGEEPRPLLWTEAVGKTAGDRLRAVLDPR